MSEQRRRSEESEFARLTAGQVKALASVAFGGAGGGHSRRTLDSLERRGLIEAFDEQHGLLRIRKYGMPLDVHARFCAWCAEQEEDWNA